MATKAVAASPFDPPPLQQVIRLEVNELVERTVPGGLKQPTREKSEAVNGNWFSLYSRQKTKPVSPKVSGLFKDLETRFTIVNCFSFRFSPG
jgi:hypothetical protein